MLGAKDQHLLETQTNSLRVRAIPPSSSHYMGIKVHRTQAEGVPERYTEEQAM